MYRKKSKLKKCRGHF